MPQSKFLVQFLQEKQEPFSLEDHLVERGYRLPSRISKISDIFGLKKRARHGIRHCSDVFKLVFSQVDSNKSIKNQENAERGRLSSATCTTTTMSSSCSESTTEHSCCSESDPEDTHCSDACSFTREGDAEGMSKLRMMEDKQQLSPVSVLEQTESVYGSPIHYKQCDSNRELEQPSKDEELQQQFHISDSYSQYIINMKILRQPGNLLIDCTREVIENHKKKDKRREHLNQILGTDQLWKSVCENVWLWSKDPIDETNTSRLVRSDISATSEKWNYCHKDEKMELAIDIGDAILDQIIHEIAES